MSLRLEVLRLQLLRLQVLHLAEVTYVITQNATSNWRSNTCDIPANLLLQHPQVLELLMQ